jgi:hypothetical protein
VYRPSTVRQAAHSYDSLMSEIKLAVKDARQGLLLAYPEEMNLALRIACYVQQATIVA